jgi:Ca2+-binding EF-hand superfamily protein
MQSITAVDNPAIEYDYDRVRLSPASFSPGFNSSLNPNSASNFRASSRGVGKVSFAKSAAQTSTVSIAGEMKASDLDVSNLLDGFDGLDQAGLIEARRKINPVTISKIRKRFRAASYTYGGQNWDKIFGQFDTSGDGALDSEEFFLAVRAGLKIPPREVSDRDIEILLQALDMNGDGMIDLIEFAAFLKEEDPEQDDLQLKRSLVGLRPAAAKSECKTSKLTHSELMMVGGTSPSLDKAKLAKEELEMQRRARAIAEQKKREASTRGWHSAKMAANILNIGDAKSR